MSDKGPCARGMILVGFRDAVRTLWGDSGLEQIRRLLPEEVRRETVERQVLPVEWLPERYVMAWYDAAFRGPAGESWKQFAAFLDKMMDLGFGRVRKLLIGAISPETMLDKAVDLWRHDHTHGVLRIQVSGQTAVATLQDHPYTTTAVSRFAIAEIYRYCLSLSRAHDVVMEHKHEAGSVHVHLKWE